MAQGLDLDALADKYRRYVDEFRDSAGNLPAMMQLKLEHTEFVCENAKAIADGEGFSPVERELALAAALLHDTGRYEQFLRYNTFRDADSIDHAKLSYDIIVEKGWTGNRAVLDAVLFHNLRELPPSLDALSATAAKTVRDADKLDIFRVLEVQVRETDWRGSSQAFWGLPVSAAPSRPVVDCIVSGKPVDYREIKSLPDFVLVQVGWMVNELEYVTSLRLCHERGHLDFRRQFLHRLTDDSSIEIVCDLAEKRLKERLLQK